MIILSTEVNLLDDAALASQCVAIEKSAMETFAVVYPQSVDWPISSEADYAQYIQESQAFGAWYDNQLVGFLVFDIIDQDQYYLAEMDVDVDYQGKGIGATLINRFLQYCQANKVCEVFLRTFSNTPWSVNLYKKFGFQTIGQDTPFLALEVQSEADYGLPMENRINMKVKLSNENFDIK